MRKLTKVVNISGASLFIVSLALIQIAPVFGNDNCFFNQTSICWFSWIGFLVMLIGIGLMFGGLLMISAEKFMARNSKK